jgi:hypothetical protein
MVWSDAAAEAVIANDEADVDAAIASATGRMPLELALIRVLAASLEREEIAERTMRGKAPRA